MFELNLYEPGAHPQPVMLPEGERPGAVPITHRSLLYWCEHCVECAAPACFKTCDLYRPRPDGKCRRFEHGIFQGAAGAEITFKKWAKLETTGSAKMFSASAADHAERWITRAAAMLPWSKPVQALFSRWHGAARQGAIAPSGFLLEVFNPGDATALQLSIRNHPPSGTAPFVAPIALPQGYSSHYFEAKDFCLVTQSGPFLISLTPAPETCPTLVFRTADFVVAPERASVLKPVKCVVWDLDGTLWDGILKETGEVRLRPEIPSIVRELDERGVLQSVASKNDHDAAHAKLVEFGLAEYFLHPQIHWGPKSESLRKIARALNLGLDSFAFVDDSAFERAEVGAFLPEVTIFDGARLDGLLTQTCLSGSATQDARNRRRYYVEEMTREQERLEVGGDYLRFLRACDIRLDIAEYAAGDFERVAELLQRTNQLNFSGRHYKREDVIALVAAESNSKYVLRCRDRYGDYGAVGFSIVNWDENCIAVDDFMLSCRVQSKFVEQAFFSALRRQMTDSEGFRVNYRATTRNRPAHDVLTAMGFEDTPDGMMLNETVALDCDFIQCQWSASRPAVAAR